MNFSKERMNFREIVKKIPKSELHLHLRGSIPLDVFVELNTKYICIDILDRCDKRRVERYHNNNKINRFMQNRKQIAINQDYSQIELLFKYTGFEDFIDTYGFTVLFIREIGDFKLLIDGVIRQLIYENIVYSEITVSLCEYLRQGLLFEDIIECLVLTSQNGAIKVNWIIDLVRDNGSNEAYKMLDKVINCGKSSFIGITLGGNESSFPLSQFSEVYNLARNHGLCLTVHTGETQEPDYIWEAINYLKVNRIGHGINSIYDYNLVEYLKIHKIPLEICITSNMKTGVVRNNYHPVRELLKYGVVITINTDDPTFFNTSLTDEYMKLYDFGISESDILEIMKNSYQYSFLRDKDKEEYIKTFNSVIRCLT